VFFLKDAAGCYRGANQAFAERLGLAEPGQLLGRRAEDFFPPELASTYRRQDRRVLADGRPILDELELIADRKRGLGWYLATKVPLRARDGGIIGLASISRDLRTPGAGEAEIEGIARVADHVRSHLADDLGPARLARLAGMSPGQLDRRMRKVYQLSTSRFVRKARIEFAADQLARTHRPIAEIALDCGYGDQTALTRQFRATVGMPPAAFRERSRQLQR
jgi:AraC-like DNA-binding protein